MGEVRHVSGYNPGSPEAGKAGCKCPTMDNHHGKGMPYPDGPRWWVASNCPIHAKRSNPPNITQ